MLEFLRKLNQYGYDVDVFDKYRGAVRNSNRDAVWVLSWMAIVSSVIISVFGVTTNQPKTGIIFCAIQAAAGVGGAVTSKRRESTRGALLLAGYLLEAAILALAIYGSMSFKTDAFWIGTQMAASCFLLDYALRIAAMHIGGYIALNIAWNIAGVAVTPERIMFSLIYLVVSLVTFYATNRTRVTLILGREESRVQADTDLLTGLTMRIAAQQEIEDHLRTDEHGVMMLMDLDRFKSVNDRLGHQKGDEVLRDVALDLKKMFRQSDVLCRLGGDEFVVYMKSVPEKEWAVQRAAQVVREARRWVSNGEINIQVTASVGIVMTDMVERNYDSLYRAADVAMYCAKSQGGNRALFYTPEMMEHAQETEDARHLTSEVVREKNEELR